MGPIEGLSAAEIKAYIRYIADWRLKQLGLPQVYGVKEHPLPWLTAVAMTAIIVVATLALVVANEVPSETPQVTVGR